MSERMSPVFFRIRKSKTGFDKPCGYTRFIQPAYIFFFNSVKKLLLSYSFFPG